MDIFIYICKKTKANQFEDNNKAIQKGTGASEATVKNVIAKFKELKFIEFKWAHNKLVRHVHFDMKNEGEYKSPYEKSRHQKLIEKEWAMQKLD